MPENHGRLSFALELKAVDKGQRLIEGYASVFGNIDSYGDIVDRGAFDATLSERGPDSIRVFIGHNTRGLPIGLPVEVRADERGLFTRTRIFQTAAGDDLLATAKAMLDAGQGLGMSIGFMTRDFTYEAREGGTYVRHLKVIELFEYSFVGLAANDLAAVSAVKGPADAQLADLAAAVKALTTALSDFRVAPAPPADPPIELIDPRRWAGAMLDIDLALVKGVA